MSGENFYPSGELQGQESSPEPEILNVAKLVKESWLIYRKRIREFIGILAQSLLIILAYFYFLGFLGKTNFQYFFAFTLLEFFSPLPLFYLGKEVVKKSLEELEKEGIDVKIGGEARYKHFIHTLALSFVLLCGTSLCIAIVPSLRFAIYIWFISLSSIDLFKLISQVSIWGSYTKLKRKQMVKEVLWGFGFLIIWVLFFAVPVLSPQYLAWYVDRGELGVHLAMLFAYLLALFVYPFSLTFLSILFNFNIRRQSSLGFKPMPKAKERALAVYFTMFEIFFIALFSWRLSWGRDIPPIDDSDLRLTKVEIPQEQNAYYDLVTAYKLAKLPPGKNAIGSMLNKPGNSREIKELVEKNEVVFSYLEKALKRPYFQSPQLADPSQIDFQTMFPEYSQIRDIARLSLLKARYLQAIGRDDEALDLMVKVVKLGQMMEDSPRPSLITYLVGRAIKEIGLKGLREIIPKLSLSSDVLHRYAKSLLQYRESEGGFERAGKMEYLVVINTLSQWESASKDRFQFTKMKAKWGEDIYKLAEGTERRELYKPNKTRLLFAQRYRRFVSNARKPFYKDIDIAGLQQQKQAPHRRNALFTDNILGKAFFDLSSFSFLPAFEQKCLGNFSVEATACLLALKAYERDKGRLPNSLRELVPDYLPYLPLDPFDGKPLRYSKVKKLIYCVGKDLVDSGGGVEKDSWTKWKDPTVKIEF